MLIIAQYAVVASLIVTVAALVFYVAAVFMAAKNAAPVRAKVLVSANELDDLLDDPAPASKPVTTRAQPASGMARYGSVLTWTALGLLTVNLVVRTIATGHGPFVTQHEFAVATSWGFLAVYLFFELKFRAKTLALLLLPVTLMMQLYALSQATATDPLVPALQNSLLLTIHIIVAIFAYGAFAVSFAAAGLYLLRGWIPESLARVLPKPAMLDRLGYQGVIIGFPLMTAVIVFGAIWAQIAWGSYWSWDPKETISLVTWLIYGGFLHARVARGWVGTRSAWLLVIGFASVIFTFFGNYLFGGLHSYAVGQ